MKKTWKKIVMLFVSIGILGFSNTIYAQPAEFAGLSDFIREAIEHNPSIQEAYHQWKAQEHKIKQAKALPDPKASYTYFGENVQTRVGPQEEKYGFSQKVPFPGKLGLKGRTESKHAQMLQEQYEATKNEIIKDVKFVYYDLFWVDKEERVKLALLTLTFFCIIASYTLVQVLKDSVFMTVIGKGYLPWIKIVSIVTMIPAIM